MQASATRRIFFVVSMLGMLAADHASLSAAEFRRLRHNHPGLVVDLGVGLWARPLPMDFDGDGDLDLLVSCHDVPSNGLYFFENTEGNVKFPVFRAAVRIGPAVSNVCVSYVDDRPVLLTPGLRHPHFKIRGLADGVQLPLKLPIHDAGVRLRANDWKYEDFDGDGVRDLVVGVGDWSAYGWDDAFNAAGEWTNGPLHGFVDWLRNESTNDHPRYGRPQRIEAGGKPIDVYGMPSPCLADFDGDGDLDLVCGEFLDRLTYFENVGSRRHPVYAAGHFLEHDAAVIRLDLCMIVPTAIDWDRDGDVDLVVGQEDGRVALIENTGQLVDGRPHFLPPRFFQQHAEFVKPGALVTPYSVDWDADGDDDLICGDTAGYLSLVENLDGGDPPKWAAPRHLKAGGETIRIQAGPNGSIQGPCETKWGYTVPVAADWNHDGLVDIVINSIWGEILWYENAGTRQHPALKAAQPIIVEWESTAPKPAWTWWEPKNGQWVTQWRTTPMVADLTGDGLNDLVMLDHEGYLSLLERYRSQAQLKLRPPERVFRGADGKPLRLNPNRAGKSGRRKFVFADWDGDGHDDILLNGANIDLWRNVGGGETRRYDNLGPLAERKLAGHTTCPTIVDWDDNGIPDLVVGAEDGYLYYLKNPLRR